MRALVDLVERRLVALRLVVEGGVVGVVREHLDAGAGLLRALDVAADVVHDRRIEGIQLVPGDAVERLHAELEAAAREVADQEHHRVADERQAPDQHQHRALVQAGVLRFHAVPRFSCGTLPEPQPTTCGLLSGPRAPRPHRRSQVPPDYQAGKTPSCRRRCPVSQKTRVWTILPFLISAMVHPCVSARRFVGGMPIRSPRWVPVAVYRVTT